MTTALDPINEGVNGRYIATLKDQSGQTIPKAQISAMTLTYYVAEGANAGDIINNRNAQNVLQQNNVTYEDSYLNLTPAHNLRWELQPTDTIIKDDTRRSELHVALFKFTYSTGIVGKHRVEIRVTNERGT